MPLEKEVDWAINANILTWLLRSKPSKETASSLRQLRESLGLTQEELSRRCHIPLRTYQRWESGETMARPTIPQIKALCKELNIPIEELPDNFGSSATEAGK